MNSLPHPARQSAFTLVELLTVIAIIAVLMGLLFPTVGAVKESARKAQAKNDVTQLVTAVKAYYTEYGKYPGTGNFSGSNKDLMEILMAESTDDNPRKIVFFEATEAKEEGRYGIQEDFEFVDPWGNSYKIAVDMNYNNKVESGEGAPVEVRTGAVAWSTGKDGSFNIKDDPVSWQ